MAILEKSKSQNCKQSLMWGHTRVMRNRKKGNKDPTKFVTIRFALAMWCLTSPPPRMIIPVLLANTAWLFNLRISEMKSTFTLRPTGGAETVVVSLQLCCFYLPRCPKPSRGSYMSGSRSCRPESRLSEQDWTLECYSDTQCKKHIYWLLNRQDHSTCTNITERIRPGCRLERVIKQIKFKVFHTAFLVTLELQLILIKKTHRIFKMSHYLTVTNLVDF